MNITQVIMIIIDLHYNALGYEGPLIKYQRIF